MKNSFHRNNIIRSVQLFTFALMAVAVSHTAIAYQDTNPATGAVNVGRAGGNTADGPGHDFAVLTNGDFSMSGNGTFVRGDVGIWDTGNYNGSGSAQTIGDVYINKNGKINQSGSANITGGVHRDSDAQTRLNGAWMDATSLYNTALAETATRSLTNVNLNNAGSMTITGGPNEKVVLQLQNFQLDNGSTFTLQGTATTSFIIDVAKNFSLDHGSKINLVGVPPANVLFVVVGSDPKLNHSSQMSGILLAVNHKVNLADHSTVTGRVIAKQVEMSGGSSVVSPVTNQ